LNGVLEETVYIAKPPRFEVGDTSPVLMLNKARYELKQALRQRFDILKSTLLQFGLLGSKCDSLLFVYRHQSHVVYFLVYAST